MGQGAELVFHDLAEWERCEAELIHRGVPVPMVHRSLWIRHVSDDPPWFSVDRDEDTGEVLAGFPVERSRVRSLPGHYRLRITRFSPTYRLEGWVAAVDQIAALVRQDPKFLSLNIEVFVPDEDLRIELEGQLSARGFTPSSSRRRYHQTPRVRLDSSEKEILKSFAGTARRAIRNPEKRGFRIAPFHESRWSTRMAELWAETFDRTGTRPPVRRWPDHLELARNHPQLYRIYGTFSPSFPEPASLVAFACARHNGDHAEYSDGASTRSVDSGVALTYAPMWALMRWARSEGCEWFDLGGISQRGPLEEDPRTGIAEFKRRFTEDIIEVGGEWELKPRTARTMFAEIVKSSTSYLRTLVGPPG